MNIDRRLNRSENIQEALRLQLAATAKFARFNTIVLAEEQGLTVATTGDTAPCEELAALSPHLVPGSRIWQGKVRTEDGTNKLITIAPVDTQWGRLYLCAVGGTQHSIASALLLGGRGVKRILA